MKATFLDDSCARYSMRPAPRISGTQRAVQTAPPSRGQYRVSERAPEVAGAIEDEVVANLTKDPRHED